MTIYYIIMLNVSTKLEKWKNISNLTQEVIKFTISGVSLLAV